MQPTPVSMSDVPVAILAGGLATRLRPITTSVPKAMVEVAGRPFAAHQVELLRDNGARRVVFCLGYLGEQVERYLGDGSAFGVQVRYSHDGDRLLGTGGALRRALPLLGPLFWVVYGDSYLDIDYAGILDHFCHSDALGLMTVYRNANQWDRSNVAFHQGRLVCYNKCTPTPEMHHIDYGAALLRAGAFARAPLAECFDLAQMYSDLVARGEMIGHEVTRRFYEIGSPAGLEEAGAYLLARRARASA
jgi:NDP-sugar pyrophosphorylase family protein